MPAPEPESKPTRARFVLVAWLCGLSSILYLDRICMSQAVDPIIAEFDLSKTEMSYVMMAFTLAYGLCAVPVGRLGDRIGPRSVLTWVVVVWSVFTALTGAATGLFTLILVRLLFGAAEAGAFPNAARIVSRWYPISERGRVQGVMLSFAQVGAIVAAPAAAYLIEALGWRFMFGTFALIGIVWAVGFWRWFRNDPADHPSVNPAELETIRANLPPPPLDPGPVPWRAVFTNYGIIVLGIIQVLASFFTYFFYSWFPKYLRDARGATNVESSWINALVIAGSLIGMLFGGWLSDRFSRLSAHPVRDRRYASMIGFFIAAVCLFVGTRCDSTIALGVLWSVSMCAMHIQQPNWWSVIIPQSGRHVATLFGLTNGVGVFGAMASQGFVGVFADWQASHGFSGRAQWDPIFDVYVVVLILGGVAWWLYRFTPLEDPNDKPTS
ncbi:MAG: MFS transporter [Planctomycetes bacterium]|nr:MFS transporter [Planctomycetota bacterium]